MANEVKTLFTGDPAQLFKTADAVEARVKELVKLSGNLTFGKVQSDTALQYANRDIKQIEAARIRSQKLIEAEIVKSEKAITAVRIREAKAANDAAIREIRRVEQLKRQATARAEFRQDLGSVLSQSGLGGFGSLVGASSSALAIGAGVALIGSGIQLAQTAIDKSIAAERANRLLSASATEAGKSYAFLAERNREFAASVGLSNTAAAETTAKIAQLATFSGNTSEQNIKNLQKGFADLAAARGIDSKDLTTLIGTILSGQDEGLNRLGLPDPSKIYEAYAKSVGKSKDSLTQFEKVQAAANAVLEKSKTFAGAAEARMNSLEGQVAKTSASWENFTESLSKGFTQNLTVQTAMKQLSDAVRGLGSDTDTLLEKLRAGKLTSEDITNASKQSAALKGLNIFGDTVGGFLLSGFNQATFGQIPQIDKAQKDTFTRLYQQLSGQSDELRRDTLQQQINGQILADAQQKKAADEATQSLQRQISATKQLTDARKESLDVLKFESQYAANATQNAFKIAEAGISTTGTPEQQLAAAKQILSLRQQALRAQSQDTLAGANRLLYSGKLSDEEAASVRRETYLELQRLNAELVLGQINGQKEIAQKEKEIFEQRKRQIGEIRDLITSNFAQSSQNPYVKIFDDAGKAIERARELTRGFSKDIQQAAIQSARAANGGSLFGQRIDTRLQVDNLQQQALRFLGGAVGRRELTGADIINGQIRNPVFETVYSGGNFSTDFTAEQKKIQDDLRRQIELVRSTPFSDIQGLKPEDRQRLINNSIADLVKGLNAEDLSGDLRGQAAQALLRQASDKIKEESVAREFYQKALAGELTVKVTGATSNIEVTSRDLSVETQQQQNPARAIRNDVKDAMGNYRQAGKYYD